jgi:hypothetical protein
MDNVKDHLCLQLCNIWRLLHFVEEDFGRAEWHIEEQLVDFTANIAHNDCMLQYIAN